MADTNGSFCDVANKAISEYTEYESSLEGALCPSELTKEQLYAFLEEIEAEDEELARDEILTAEALEEDRPEDEENNILQDIVNDSEGRYNKASWTENEQGELVRTEKEELFTIGENIVTDNSGTAEKTSQEERASKLKDAMTNWHHNRDLIKIEINRMAFNQKVLPLSNRLTQEHKRLVIEILTRPIRNLITKYEKYINSRVTRLMSPAIPPRLKLDAEKWPWVFIQNPGFLYKTHERNGEVKTFWVTPDVPYYFKQGTEQAILEERDASLSVYVLDGIDKAIHRWYKAKENLARREVAYALKMIGIKGNTYYHLLVLNPFWFEKLYTEIKIKQDRENESKTSEETSQTSLGPV